jgi:lipid-binding SYLF domain-containing protein
MNWKSFVTFALLLALGGASTGLAQEPSSEDYKDAIEQSNKAAKVFTEIMSAPDQEIPEGILGNAECVMVFPEVVKAGFIVGGRGGRGVASCRTAGGWTAPAYFDLGGGSIGLQIGAQMTDFVLLIMNEEGMAKLLGDKFELGADASAAAGPVGRQAGLSTNVRMDAEILSYSRSKGLFAGLELKGVVIKPDKDNVTSVYGPTMTAKALLEGAAAKQPAEVMAFSNTLAKYSPAKEQ